MENKYTVTKEILFEWFKYQLSDFEEVVMSNRVYKDHPYHDLPNEWEEVTDALYNYVREYAEREDEDFLMKDFFQAQMKYAYDIQKGSEIHG